MDKENNSLTPATLTGMDALCRNSIELIQYARKVAAGQINLVQLMTYYAIGRWIVEKQQSGEHRAGYGKKVIQTLSNRLNAEFGKGFSVDTLENTRKFYLCYRDRISEATFRKFTEENTKQCFGFLMRLLPLHCHGLIICSLCGSRIRMRESFVRSKPQHPHGVCGCCNVSTIPACMRDWHSAVTKMRSCD